MASYVRARCYGFRRHIWRKWDIGGSRWRSSYYGQINGELNRNPNWVHSNNSIGLEQSSTGFHHNHSGVYEASNQKEFQSSPTQQNGSVRGFSGYSNGQPQQSPNESLAQNAWGFQHNINGFHGGTSEVRQNPNGLNSQGLLESQGSLNRNHMQNLGQSHASSNDYHTTNGGVYQESHNASEQIQGVGHYQHNPNVGRYWQNSNVGQPQQNNYGGQYQQNPSVGLSGQSTKFEEYQQTSNFGQYNPNSNNYQNMMVASQVSNNSKPEEGSAEASASNPSKGTLEELDNFLKGGKVKEAVEVLGLLEKQQITVDLPRYLQLIYACGEAKDLQEPKAVHEHIIRSLLPLNVSTYNRILEMYSKCGAMDNAVDLFNKMPERNLTSWDTMITWLAKNGLGEDAIDLFTEFKKAGLKPDSQMFIGVFRACSVLGDINEGMLHFESMSKDYGIVPSMELYVNVVDMLGSNGYLDEALEFIENMSSEPSVDVWETLMNHCRVHGHLELGDRCAELIEQLDPSRLKEQSKAGLVPVKSSDIAKAKEKKKLETQDLLQVRNRIHEYRAGDTSSPENDKLYALLRGMKAQMNELGYIPELRFVLHDIDHEGKEEALLGHSERLAVAHGLLSSPARSPIRVIKNLRVCGDCHTALKIISKLVGRTLIIRDAKRFHHFENGLCSCRDYW